jgi:hypothetical protein
MGYIPNTYKIYPENVKRQENFKDLGADWGGMGGGGLY